MLEDQIAAAPAAVANIFANIESLRLASGSRSSAVTEILTHIPVRKPGKGEFFRVHPEHTMALDTVIYEDPEDRNQTYLVPPAMREFLQGQTKDVLLLTAINRQNVLFLWPLTIPLDSQPVNPWQTSARDAAELGKTLWVRMQSDMSLKAYRVFKAEGLINDPVWPGKPLSDILEIAFRNHVIDDMDHPLVRRLRGL
jgi:hypothetical protein